jgi:ABC-2 type transport system permease protein
VIRAVWAEAHHAGARRLVRFTAVLLGVAALAGGTVAYAASSPLSEGAFRRRTEAVELRRREAARQMQRCLADTNGAAEQCVAEPVPSARDPRFHLRQFQSVLRGASGVLALVAWVVGASLIGAEHHSRSLTTTLTVEPRRLRLFGAKALVAVGLGLALMVGALVLTALALVPAATLHGAPTAGEPGFRALGGVVARGAGLAAIAAVLGFSLASLGRSTAAALGVGFAYLVVFENVLGGISLERRRWLLVGNAIVLVSGGDAGGEVPGRSVAAAGLFLAAVAAASLVGAGAAFRTREVA